jgi:LytS/YehU family sensor histidine kinase
VQRVDLFSGKLQRRLLLFGATNLVIILVHAAYRVPLHHFVYPAMQPIPPLRLFRLYALGNALNDFWVFWSIVALAHLITHYMRQAERERAVVRAQMQALKSQLQPHFFFNALNSISSLMRDDVDAADDMITRLGDLLRVSLRIDPAHEIPLQQELRIIETYIDIERMRFSDRLRFTCDLSGDAGQAKVPALILLPLVENAVHHGIAQRSQPGEVRISARTRDGNLLLTVSNDLAAPQVAFAEGIGLAGTRRRLAQHYGSASSFTYHASPQSLMTVQITVPFVADKEFALHADSSFNC